MKELVGIIAFLAVMLLVGHAMHPCNFKPVAECKR